MTSDAVITRDTRWKSWMIVHIVSFGIVGGYLFLLPVVWKREGSLSGAIVSDGEFVSSQCYATITSVAPNSQWRHLSPLQSPLSLSFCASCVLCRWWESSALVSTISSGE